MRFDKNFIVSVDNLETVEEAKAMVKFLWSEAMRHSQDVAEIIDKIHKVMEKWDI